MLYSDLVLGVIVIILPTLAKIGVLEKLIQLLVEFIPPTNQPY
jgi:hypothetical protein